MAKGKTLLDLYVRGKEVSFHDTQPDGTTIELKVWVQKLNPVEHDKALKKANAARARSLSLRFDKDSDDYQALLDEILRMERAALEEILALTEQARISPLRAAETADDEKWKTDDYLTGLQEAWADGLSDTFEDDPEDAEAARVHSELQQFIDQVAKAIDDEMESFRVSLSTMSERELVESVMEHQIKTGGDIAWVNEFYRWEAYFATRRADDHGVRVFASRAQLDELQDGVFDRIHKTLREITVDPVEGKGLAGDPPSSDS